MPLGHNPPTRSKRPKTSLQEPLTSQLLLSPVLELLQDGRCGAATPGCCAETLLGAGERSSPIPKLALLRFFSMHKVHKQIFETRDTGLAQNWLRSVKNNSSHVWPSPIFFSCTKCTNKFRNSWHSPARRHSKQSTCTKLASFRQKNNSSHVRPSPIFFRCTKCPVRLRANRGARTRACRVATPGDARRAACKQTPYPQIGFVPSKSEMAAPTTRFSQQALKTKGFSRNWLCSDTF